MNSRRQGKKTEVEAILIAEAPAADGKTDEIKEEPTETRQQKRQDQEKQRSQQKREGRSGGNSSSGGTTSLSAAAATAGRPDGRRGDLHL